MGKRQRRPIRLCRRKKQGISRRRAAYLQTLSTTQGNKLPPSPFHSTIQPAKNNQQISSPAPSDIFIKNHLTVPRENDNIYTSVFLCSRHTRSQSAGDAAWPYSETIQGAIHYGKHKSIRKEKRRWHHTRHSDHRHAVRVLCRPVLFGLYSANRHIPPRRALRHHRRGTAAAFLHRQCVVSLFQGQE